MSSPSPKPHDRSHRLLFSHARLVRDLLSGFLDEPWVDDLDLETLESLPTDFVSRDGPQPFEERSGDVIWKVRYRDRDVYIVILLELQSGSDPLMALRLTTYEVLFYGRLDRADPMVREGLFPTVLPIVFYNGERPWSAALELRDLIQPAPEGLEAYVPSMRYIVIDERRWPLDQLPSSNFVSVLINAEQGTTVEDFEKTLNMLASCLSEGSDEAHNLGRDIVAWLSRVILPQRVPEAKIPEIHQFDEFETYVEANMQTWTEQWKAEGLAEGMQKGMQQGMQQGMQKGMHDGKAELLASLIRRKFGEAAVAGLREQLKAASLEQLDRWAERVLTAESAEDVIG
jgi:predicted transposase YdaD